MNFGEEATADAKVIEYSYQNESNDPMSRNRFRRVTIRVKNILTWTKFDTKSMRFIIERSGELGDTNLASGKVFSLILDDMAKFRSVIFDYNRCIKESKEATDITIFLFKRYDTDLALKVMVVNINRVTDKISILGKELSAADIWSDDLADPDLINNHQIPLDKGYLRLIMEGKPSVP